MIPRPEYPRPQWERKNWINLNGKWEFAIDRANSGEHRKMYQNGDFPLTIELPFCPESTLSGIGDVDFMDCVWYRRKITLPEDWVAEGRRTVLNIGACDYETKVWVNGKYLGRHIGGYVTFSFDITEALQGTENTVVISATDLCRSKKQPVGKQSRMYYSHACDYTRTTGIWQTVWLENLPNHYIRRAKYRPSVENQNITIEAICENANGKTLTATAYYDGKAVGRDSAVVSCKTASLRISLSELQLWEIGNGRLYDLVLELDGDTVYSYFGMRALEYKEGKAFINGKAVFQRLILDQGFYPDGIYTAPSEAALLADITRSMDMGFNGARLHQKVFEPRFLYHCDRLGYIVWGEHASWGLDLASPHCWQGFLPEWQEILERDCNHPAIIGWCPLNETRVPITPEFHIFVKALGDFTRSFDPDRIYIDSSGYYHFTDTSDLWDAHDYEQDPEVFRAHYAPLAEGEPIIFGRYKQEGHPTFISEFGGIWWDPNAPERGWGYGGKEKRPKSEEEFLARYRGLITATLENKGISAFCYTQLTDVEQETNGLYTYDRKPKFDIEVLRSINTQKAAIEEE